MPWRPLPRIAFAVAIYPFQPSSPADLPLELGDELYIIEQGGVNGSWYRGYLVAPPSLLAGLTSVAGQTLEARVFSGIFPKNCVEVREVLGDAEGVLAKDGGRSSAEPFGHVNGISRPGTATPDGVILADNKYGVNGYGDAKSPLKISQVAIVRLEDEGRPESGASSRSPSVPLTPIPLGPRDPNSTKPPAPVPMLKIGDETPTSASEPLVDEIASCLREWHSTNIHQLLLTRQYSTLESISNLVSELDFARRQLLHNVLTNQERLALREEVVWKLVRGNKMLSGEVIVRDPKQRGRLLTGDDSAIELTKLQSEMSMLESGLKHHTDCNALHHLLFEVSAISGTNAGSVTLAMSLYLKSSTGEVKQLSETYSLEIPGAESFSTLVNNAKLKTLFTDLNSTDIGEGSGANSKLYLVVKIQGSEPPRSSQSSNVRATHSRDGSINNRTTATMNSAGKGSLKGRRSMIWGPKSRGSPFGEQGKDNAKRPPQSSDSSMSQERSGDVAKETNVIRTVGAGVLEVGNLLLKDKEVEQSIDIWSPLGEYDEEEGRTEGFDETIRSILPSPTGRYGRSHRAARLHTNIRPLRSDDADLLIRSNPTLLHNVTQTRRIGFAKAPTKPRSDIYLTLSRAVISHDALLSHPYSGQVPVPQLTGLRNLQLTLEVRNAEGTRVDHCIFPLSNSHGHTAWRTTVTERGSSWNQTIRLNIPTDEVPNSHLVMSIADAPEFPFALSWMPLWDQQAFIRDGRHSLLLHAYDKTTSSIENGKGAYLSLPWSSLGKNECTKDEALTGPLATLSLETNLVSTEYSQDQIILGLINWRERSSSEILELLRRVVFVPEIEIVKQLSDVFDSLFGIMVDNAGNEEYEDLVFNDVIIVLGIVHDRRFNVGPLVDNYAEKQFNFPFATPCLIRSYCRLLQATPDSQQSRNLRAAFKVGRHLLKFIINARQQQKAKEEGIGVTKVQSSFNRDLHFIFELIQILMKNPMPNLVGNKTLVVQHFHTWIPELTKALSKEETIEIALNFMDSCKNVKSMLILYKLVLISNYTRLPLFETPKERQLLVSRCVKWLGPYWGHTDEVSDQYRDQVRLCSSIVAELLRNPIPELYELMPEVVASFCAIQRDGVEETEYLSVLFSKSFPFQLKKSKTKQRFDEGLVELAAIMAALARISSPKLPSFDQYDLAIFLSHAFDAHKTVLQCEAYPSTWLSIHIYHHRSIMKSLEYLSTILIDSFLPSPDDADTFDMELWKSFFVTLLTLVSSDGLALETFPEQKRRAVWKIAGDVRENGAALLRRTWEAIGWETSQEDRDQYGLKTLGGFQVQYVPALVYPIVELCLSVHEGLRHVAVEILQTMIVSEWQLNEDLAVVEAEIISSLDILFKAKNLNESVTQKLFINELLGLFETDSESADTELLVALKELIATIDELLDLLVASHSGSINESLNTLKLMEFMKDMQKEDIFIRYVHELAQAQAVAGNSVEAGLALQFHADLYDWDPTKPIAALSDPYYPEQSSFDRKEALFFEIIQHFEEGKAWAHALSCYRELADHYEHTVLDFSKLARAHASIAKLYESVLKDEQLHPRYFRVTFKGLGFPTTLRDKQYIFEGLPTDRMATFTDRMQKHHPASQIVSSGEIENLEGQFIQISAVSVHKDMSHPVYQRSKVPQSVREHLLSSVPSQFSVTTKRQMGGNNVKEQWVAKTVYTSAEPFPNVLRRSEIIATEEVGLTPLQTAIERSWRKTHELSYLEKRIASGDDSNMTGLTEVLSQLVDLESEPSTSIALYRQFLPDEEEIDLVSNPEVETDDIIAKPVDPLKNALAVALIDHALAIRRCISLYSRPAYQATQVELTRRFEAAFAPEIASLAPTLMVSTAPEPSTLQHSRSQVTVNGTRDRKKSGSHSRPPSPEQELLRSSRNDKKNQQIFEKPTTSNRISLNPFKRTHHATTSSTTTITAALANLNSHHDSRKRSESKTNGATSERPHTGKADPGETASVAHSRTTSRSRGRSDTNPKRRSFFGGTSSSGNTDTRKNSISTSTPAASTEDIHTTQQRIIERARPSQSHDRPNGVSQIANPTAAKGEVRRSSSDTVSPSKRPRTSERHASQGNNEVVHGSGGSGHSSSGSRSLVMKKRFSLLKVGKKGSRANVREGNAFAGALHEE